MPNDTRAAPHPEAFDITSLFAGRTTAHGIVEDRFGKLKRRFDVDMHGRWEGGVFVLDEHFAYDDGERESRTWLVRPDADGRFTATTADCVGEASGSCSHDVIRMRYRFSLKVGGRSVTVDFDDRIYRLDGALALNRATISKWGVRLGELALVFKKMPS